MKITNDEELDAAIAKLDGLLDQVRDLNASNPLSGEIEELSNAIEEYEERTDVLNRDETI